jgi:hypothetical protein
MPIIQGNLPFNQLGAAGQAMAPVFQGNPQQAMNALGPAYAAGYGAIADFNGQGYGNILKGFQDTAQQMQGEQQQINSGYGALRQDVRDQLAGYGRSAENDLNAQYAQAQGAAGQSLVSRGLGNSTIADSVQRGLGYDRARAGIDLGDRLTAQRVGFDASLGQAGLGFQERASGANAGLAQQQLGWMNSVSAPYPNAGLFSQLAGQYGAMGQADKDRQQIMAAAGAANAAANRPQAGPTSVGGGTGFFRPGAGEGFAGLGGEAPSIGGGMGQMRKFAPPLGAVTSQAQGDAANAYFNSLGAGLGQYTGGDNVGAGLSALGGVAGFAGLGTQFGGGQPLVYPGEGEQPYGAALGGAGDYSRYLPASSGGAGVGFGTQYENAAGAAFGGLGAAAAGLGYGGGYDYFGGY